MLTFGGNVLRNFHRVLVRKNFRKTPKRNFIYKTFENVRMDGNVRVLPSKDFESRRYILRKHGLGFSFHETILYKGKSQFFNYANHLQAAMVIKGKGWVELVGNKEDLGKGRRFELYPGCMYALDDHEKHWVGCYDDEDLHCISIYTPPIQGNEQYEDGVYPFIGDDGVPDYNFWTASESKGQPITVQLSPTTYRDSHYYDLVKDAMHQD